MGLTWHPAGLEGVPAPSFLPFLLGCCLSPEAALAMGDGGSLLASPEDARCGERLYPPTPCEGREMCVKRMEFLAGPLLTHSCVILSPAPSCPEAPPCSVNETSMERLSWKAVVCTD